MNLYRWKFANVFLQSRVMLSFQTWRSSQDMVGDLYLTSKSLWSRTEMLEVNWKLESRKVSSQWNGIYIQQFYFECIFKFSVPLESLWSYAIVITSNMLWFDLALGFVFSDLPRLSRYITMKESVWTQENTEHAKN